MDADHFRHEIDDDTEPDCAGAAVVAGAVVDDEKQEAYWKCDVGSMADDFLDSCCSAVRLLSALPATVVAVDAVTDEPDADDAA